MPESDPVRPEDLVAHAASVRALASHLLGDAHLAEDVAQDTAIAALTRPPRRGVPLGPWLRGVARHLALRRIRSDARRRRREETASRPEVHAPDDVVERAEIRHVVVGELLAMDDPWRRTLLLRWFEGMEPGEIAEREGVPAATVRSRLCRSAEILRGRLDARSRGDRAAWAVPLAAVLSEVPPAAPPDAGPLRENPGPASPSGSAPDATCHAAVVRAAVPGAAGGLLMSAKWIAAAALVVVACLAGWALRQGEERGSAVSGFPADGSAGGLPASAPEERHRVRPATGEAPNTAPPTPTPVVEAEVWIAGRVLGEGRHPAPGVNVLVLRGDGDPLTGRTDDVGHFRIAASLPAAEPVNPPWAAVHARAADGRVAVRAIALERSEKDLDAGTLVLGPARALDVEVRADGAPAAGVRVTAGRSWPCAAAVTDASGRAALGPLPEGEYDVEAYDPARGHAFTAVTLPGAADPVPLLLTSRDVAVTVVRKGTSDPVPGARASVSTVRVRGDVHHVSAWRTCMSEPSGADGTIVFRGLATEGRMSISLIPPGTAGRRGDRELPSRFLRPDESAVRFELPGAGTFRFRVLDGEVAPPPEGTVLRLVPWTHSGMPVPAETGVMHAGEVVVESAGADLVSCFALTPEGTVALLSARSADGMGEATFRRERTLDVSVRDTSGRPLAERWVVARDQGNNPVQPPAATGADGTVTFRNLWGHLLDVSVIDDPKFAFGGRRAGSVNLDQGSARLDVTVPDEVRARLRVTIGGRPGLPTDYAIQGGRVESEDPDAGTIDVVAVPAHPGAPVVLTVRPAGFVPARIEFAPRASGPVEVTLQRAGSVVYRIALPADGQVSATLEQWNEQNTAWRPWAAGPGRVPGQGIALDAAGRAQVGSVPPGRYRLLDDLTRAASEPFVVAEGKETDAGLLDLSRAGPVTGRVLVPDGASCAGVTLVVEAAGLAPRARGWDSQPTHAGEDGTFTIRVPGDRPVRLRAVHTTLRAPVARPFVEVTAPAEGVELALERGPVATLRGSEAIRPGQFGSAPKVRLYEGEPSDAPVAEIDPEVTDGAIRFGIPRTGRLTVYVDAPPSVPLVLRNVAFGEKDLDLGTHEFGTGSSVRLKLLVPVGQSPPRIGAWITATAAPTYSRGTNSNGEAEVVLRGLGPGTFDLTASPNLDIGLPGWKLLRRTISVDGAATTEIVVEMDLR